MSSLYCHAGKIECNRHGGNGECWFEVSVGGEQQIENVSRFEQCPWPKKQEAVIHAEKDYEKGCVVLLLSDPEITGIVSKKMFGEYVVAQMVIPRCKVAMVRSCLEGK